jgi:APA family basic amino acid/polyamine antiporter
VSRELASTEAPARRVLGFWTLLSLGINGIVGVGVFFAPSELARLVPGPASALAFVLTALLLMPVAWSYGRLGSAYAEDGGPYVWAREAFGLRFAFAVGFVAYVSAVLSTAAIVSGLGQYLAPELGLGGAGGRWTFEVVTALLFASITLAGLRPSAWIWSALTVLKLVPLLLLALRGAAGLADLGSLGSATPVGAGLWRAALLAVFPMQGFEIVPVPAGEARAGRAAVQAATLGSLAFAAVLYVLLQLACVLSVPGLATSKAPIVEAGAQLARGRLSPLFSVGANVSAVGIAFGMFAMTPRYLAALGTRELLGAELGREWRGVPAVALVVTWLAVTACVCLSSLSSLFMVSSLAVLLQYAVSAVALFRLALGRRAGLGRVDLLLAPLTLLSIVALARSARLQEAASLAGTLLVGWALLGLRRWLAKRNCAR